MSCSTNTLPNRRDCDEIARYPEDMLWMLTNLVVMTLD